MNIQTIEGIHEITDFTKLAKPVIMSDREFIYEGKMNGGNFILFDKFGHCPNFIRTDVFVDLTSININEIPLCEKSAYVDIISTYIDKITA